MISREELRSDGVRHGFNLGQAEKDYLQHLFLHALYRNSATEFVFKGGTAIQKALGLDRFSEDLDFTYTGLNLPEKTIHDAVSSLSTIIESEIGKSVVKGNSATYKIRMEGPLYDGTPKSVQSLTLEISMRENPLKKTKTMRIVPVYRTLSPYVACIMDEEEILAEKIRALITRNKARDLYDLWFLLKKNVRFDKGLADKKLSYYDAVFSYQKLKESVDSKEKIWSPELKILMANVPPYKEIAEYVKKRISQ